MPSPSIFCEPSWLRTGTLLPQVAASSSFLVAVEAFALVTLLLMLQVAPGVGMVASPLDTARAVCGIIICTIENNQHGRQLLGRESLLLCTTLVGNITLKTSQTAAPPSRLSDMPSSSLSSPSLSSILASLMTARLLFSNGRLATACGVHAQACHKPRETWQSTASGH